MPSSVKGFTITWTIHLLRNKLLTKYFIFAIHCINQDLRNNKFEFTIGYRRYLIVCKSVRLWTNKIFIVINYTMLTNLPTCWLAYFATFNLHWKYLFVVSYCNLKSHELNRNPNRTTLPKNPWRQWLRTNVLASSAVKCPFERDPWLTLKKARPELVQATWKLQRGSKSRQSLTGSRPL